MPSPPLAGLHPEAVPVPDLLTVPQVMARLQLDRSAGYDLFRTGQFASITLGRARRIPTHALTDFIHARQEASTPTSDSAFSEMPSTPSAQRSAAQKPPQQPSATATTRRHWPTSSADVAAPAGSPPTL